MSADSAERSEQRTLYFVGAPWKGHASHSGYEVFCGQAGNVLWRFPCRDLPTVLGKIIDRTVGLIVRRRYFTFGNLLTELYACLHLLLHPRAHYHVLYGDSDVQLLPWLLRHVRRSASATLHLPAHRLPAEFRHESLRGFHTIITLAEVHRAEIEHLLPWARVITVEHPVDRDFFCPDPADSLDADSTGPDAVGMPTHRRLLSVGGHLRDFGTLADSVDKLLADDAIDDVRLVGVPKGERHHFDRFDRDAEGDGPVQILDGIDDGALRDLYRHSSISVLSLSDAYANNALLEALACGCIIVASAVGAVAEYLGGGGTLVPPGDADQLASTIALALNAPAAFIRAQRAAARARSASFDIDVIADRFREAVLPS